MSRPSDKILRYSFPEEVKLDRRETLWDPRLSLLKAYIDPSEVDFHQDYWQIIAAWVTHNGSWDDVPAWAKQWQLDTLGGDHHSFCRVYRDGQVLPGAGFILTWPDSDGVQRTPEPDGWANFVLGPSGYAWKDGPGPYQVRKFGNAEILRGLGLPYPPLPWQAGEVTPEGGCHISWFCVWEYVKSQQPPTPPDPEPDPDPEPPSGWVNHDLGIGPFIIPVRLRLRKV